MASRIIHLAITNELISKCEFNDIERLRLGAIIPDGVSNRDEYSLSHFKLKINDDERTYDLTKFRNLFKDKMMTDDLYLGYYLHLIEDLIFRNFVYDKYKWDPRPEGNVERLYEDYRQINSFLINKYNMQSDILVPSGFEKEEINKVAVFDVHKFIEEYKNISYPSGDFVDKEGNVLGKHNGLIRYTIGQRKGLNIALFDFGLLNIGIILGVSLIVGFIGTIFPVFKASRKPPVESIRSL